MENILTYCGYYFSNVRPKDKRYIESIDILNYLQDENMINIMTDLNTIKYDSVIELKIINENFDAQENFTIIDSNEFNTIVASNKNINIENLINVFLYVKSFIFKRKPRQGDTEFKKNKDRPESFYKEIAEICNDTGLSKETVSKCLDELTNLNLLIKHETGSCIKNKNGKNRIERLPNIYVLKNQDYDKEIELTLNLFKEFYNVESFIS